MTVTPTANGETRAPGYGKVIADEKSIPEWLRVGGALDQRIAAAQTECTSPKLLERCRTTIVRLREAFARTKYWQLRDPSEPVERVLGEYRLPKGSESLDIVILAWAYLQQSSSIPSDLTKDTFEAFLTARPAYEAMLGNISDGRFLEALDRYCSDTGRYSVADEFGVRRRHLTTRSAAPPAPSGYSELDRLLGGLSGYVLVSGNPATDPGILALNLTYHALAADPTAAALVVPLARAKGEVLDRLLGIATGLPVAAATNLAGPDTDRAYDEAVRSTVLDRMDLLERSGDESNYDPQDWFKRLVNRARKLVKRTRVRRLVILIDPLHEVRFPAQERSETSETSNKHYYTESELDRLRFRLIRDLLDAAEPLNPAVLAVNKSTKVPSGQRMGLDDIYGGVDILYPATTVLLLDRDDRTPTGDTVPHVLTVAKAENGVTGEVPLNYTPTTRSFTQKGAGLATNIANPLAVKERPSSKRGGKR